MQSQEQAADSRAERLAGRAEGKRVAAEKAEAAVGARPLHVTSQLGLVAQRTEAARQGLGGEVGGGEGATGEAGAGGWRGFVSGCEGPRHRGIV